MADGLLSGLLDPSQAPGADQSGGLLSNPIVLASALGGLGQGFANAGQWSRLPITNGMAFNQGIGGLLFGFSQGVGALYNSQKANADIQSAQADAASKKIAAAQALQKFSFANSILNGSGLSGQPAAAPSGSMIAQGSPMGVPANQNGPAPVDPSAMGAPGAPGAPAAPGASPAPMQAAPAPGQPPAPSAAPAQVTGQVQAPYASQSVPIDRVRGILSGSVDSWNPNELESALLAGSYSGLNVSNVQNRLKKISDMFGSGQMVTTDPTGKPQIVPVPGFNATTMGTAQATALGTSLGSGQQTTDANGNIVPMAGSLQSKAASSIAGSAGQMAADAARIQEEKAARAATPTLIYNPSTGQNGTINTAQGQNPPPGFQVAAQQTPLQSANIDANKSVITTAPAAIQGLRTDNANIQGLKGVVTDPSFQSGGFQGALAPIRSLLSNQLGPQAVANLSDQQLLDAYKGSVSLAVARSNIGQSGRLDQQEVKATADSVGSLGNTPYALRARTAALETLNNTDQSYTAGKLAAVNNGGNASDYDQAYFATHPQGIYTPADQAAFKLIATPVKPNSTVTLPSFNNPADFASWYQRYSPYFDPTQTAAVAAAANRLNFNGKLFGGQ